MLCCMFSSIGPMKKTVDDFWRMLWEQRVFVVVMTTKLGHKPCDALKHA